MTDQARAMTPKALERAREYDRVLVRTYRYLRIGMVGLVLLLAVALVIDRVQTGTVLGSISAYYHTPVHSIFVASLCATGALLVVYRGYSDIEDLVLDVAGFLAFVVALVPTRLADEDRQRAETVIAVPRSTVLANLGALLVVTAAAMVVWALIRKDPTTKPGTPQEQTDDRRALWAFRVLVVGYVVVVVIYFAGRDFLFSRGHWSAAVALLAAIVVVVAVNAVGYARKTNEDGAFRRRDLLNWYGWGLLVMLLSTALVLALGERGLGVLPNWVFWLEASIILQFGVLWIVQTVEHWNDPTLVEELTGARPDPRRRG